MTEVTTRPVDYCGHVPDSPIQRDPDFDRWVAYWQEMRQEALIHVGDAFDAVARDWAAGDQRAGVDILLFADSESGNSGRFGVYGAIGDLLLTYSRALLAASELRAGVSMDDVVGMVG